VVFSRSGLCFYPVEDFFAPIGLLWLYGSRSVQGYSIHPFSLPGLYEVTQYTLSLPAPALNCFSLCDLQLFVNKRMQMPEQACRV